MVMYFDGALFSWSCIVCGGHGFHGDVFCLSCCHDELAWRCTVDIVPYCCDVIVMVTHMYIADVVLR
jgi:hypothetical protein